MNQATIQKLFVEQIRDIYDAEKQLVKALPDLAAAAESTELGNALRKHLQETQNQVRRLEEVFSLAGVAPKGKTCKGMKGLIEEGSEAAAEQKGPVRDLAIIAGAQRVEHYEISAYGTARTLAEELDMNDAVKLLQETEDEEKNADETLTTIALRLIDGEESEDVEDVKPATFRSGGGGR